MVAGGSEPEGRAGDHLDQLRAVREGAHDGFLEGGVALASGEAAVDSGEHAELLLGMQAVGFGEEDMEAEGRQVEAALPISAADAEEAGAGDGAGEVGPRFCRAFSAAWRRRSRGRNFAAMSGSRATSSTAR